MLSVFPIWIAILLGILIGWSWKPNWANLKKHALNLNPFVPKTPGSLNSMNPQLTACIPSTSTVNSSCSSMQIDPEKSVWVNKDDFKHLWRLVEVKDGGPAWIQMMDRSTPNMTYQAWKRDPETGPPQYRSRSVFENVGPELVREFFWDDEFRSKWDDMLISASTLEECPTTGTMLVHWIRKFPLLCSDREYVIGRRIWNMNDAYYCVTKGVPSSFVPRRNQPQRVDLYYSSWCIRSVESKRRDSQQTACEVILFHHEDMGISWNIAKFGVKQGMWGAVKKIEIGLRAYQKERFSGAPPLHCGLMAQINTKVTCELLKSLEIDDSVGDDHTLESIKNPLAIESNIPKIIILGGVIILALSLNRTMLTKPIILGVARRFVNIGRRL